MLTEREQLIVDYLRREADMARHAQASRPEPTEKLYRMGSKDALLLAVDAIERGEPFKRPAPTIPASEWVKVPSVGYGET